MALLESRSYLLETGASKEEPFILHLWYVHKKDKSLHDFILKSCSLSRQSFKPGPQLLWIKVGGVLSARF